MKCEKDIRTEIHKEKENGIKLSKFILYYCAGGLLGIFISEIVMLTIDITIGRNIFVAVVILGLLGISVLSAAYSLIKYKIDYLNNQLDEKAYFVDIPNIGDLYLDRVIVEETYPIFFTLISEKERRYICTCCEIYKEQRWLIAPISDLDLVKMLKDEILMRGAFLTQNDEKCIIAHWSKENPTTRYDIVNTRDLPNGDLPLEEYLELDDDEMAEHIELLEQDCI